MPLPFQENAKKLYGSFVIEISVAVLITVNFIVSAVNAQIRPQEGTEAFFIFSILEWFFGIVFSVELVINLYGHWWREFWSSTWNWFDFVIVLISLASLAFGNLPGISVLRLFRAFRVFRLFKRIESLRLIIEGVLKSLPGVANAFVVVILIQGIWSIIGVNFFAEEFPEFFCTFFMGLFTLFQVMTGDSWCSGIARPCVLKYGPIAFIYFLSYMFIAGILMTNVVVAILLERFLGAVNEANEAKEEVRRQEEAEKFALTMGGGSVDLKIVKGTDLKPMDFSVTRFSRQSKDGGTSDPYVRVLVQGEREIFRTNVQDGTLNPIWEESCRFTVGIAETFLVLEVVDHDLTSKDDSMGQVKLNLDDHIGEEGLKSVKAQWYDVEASADCEQPEGKICVKIVHSKPKERSSMISRQSMLRHYGGSIDEAANDLHHMQLDQLLLHAHDNESFDEIFHRVHKNISTEVKRLKQRIEGVRRVLSSKELNVSPTKGPWKAAFAAQDGDLRFFCGQDNHAKQCSSESQTNAKPSPPQIPGIEQRKKGKPEAPFAALEGRPPQASATPQRSNNDNLNHSSPVDLDPAGKAQINREPLPGTPKILKSDNVNHSSTEDPDPAAKEPSNCNPSLIVDPDPAAKGPSNLNHSSTLDPDPAAKMPSNLNHSSTEDPDPATKGPTSTGSLPGKDIFRKAAALCEEQRWKEAEPLFQQVLGLLREASEGCGEKSMKVEGGVLRGDALRVALRIAEADVWAHLGVLRQSLNRMPEALDSYIRAVEFNPGLHACFANLASLYAHRDDFSLARSYINRALVLDPENPAYLGIKGQIDAADPEMEAQAKPLPPEPPFFKDGPVTLPAPPSSLPPKFQTD